MGATIISSQTDFHDEVAEMCLRSAREEGLVVETVRAFRVSSQQPSQFIANLSANLQMVDHNDAAVARARKVGGLLVERTVEGAKARAEHGTLSITPAKLTANDTSQAVIGYATLFAGTLFLYLMHSAASANLHDAVESEDRGNASVETFRQVIRAATEVGRSLDPGYRVSIHFADETRAARSKAQAAKLMATIKHYKVRLFLRGKEWDLDEVADSQVVDMLLGMAAAERDLGVHRMVRGKVNLLAIHRLPEELDHTVPFTHVAYEEMRTDENNVRYVQKDEHRPVAAAGSGARVNTLVRRVLAEYRKAEEAGKKAINWNALAEELAAELDLRERSPESIKKGQRRLISALKNPGGALRRILSAEYRQAWRTGRLPGSSTRLGAGRGSGRRAVPAADRSEIRERYAEALPGSRSIASSPGSNRLTISGLRSAASSGGQRRASTSYGSQSEQPAPLMRSPMARM